MARRATPARSAVNPCPLGMFRYMKIADEIKKYDLIQWMDTLAPWETFFTGTTQWRSSSKCLQRVYESFMKKYYPGVSYVYSLEPHKTRGWVRHGDFYPAFHMHSMFDGGHAIEWTKFFERWFGKYGRCSTEPIRHKANVQTYVSKYIMKEQEDESNNQLKELWWDVRLSKYRKHQLGIVKGVKWAEKETSAH